VYIQEGAVKSQLAKWGNSLAVRVPKAVAEAASLREGDDLEFSVEASGSVSLRRPKTKPTLQDLVRGITAENVHSAVEWGEAIGNELW
jgi:antitoxin MazE